MMKNSLKRFTAVLACTALTAALALPARAAEDQPIRVGSYKGTTLEVGERSGLVIGPGGPAYTVTSSDPDTVEVEQVMNFWTAVAKAGERGDHRLQPDRGNRHPDADRWLPCSAGSHRRE